MKAISADSHAVEGPDVFTGLADRFGDDAPEVLGKMFEGLADTARRKITRDNVRSTRLNQCTQSPST